MGILNHFVPFYWKIQHSSSVGGYSMNLSPTGGKLRRVTFVTSDKSHQKRPLKPMVSTLPLRDFGFLIPLLSAARIGNCITSGIKPALSLLLFALPRSLYSVEVGTSIFLSGKRLSGLEESQCKFSPTERCWASIRAASFAIFLRTPLA